MTTLNMALVATEYINEEATAGVSLTDAQEYAEVQLKFVPQGTPAPGMQMTVRIEQTSYDPFPPPSTPIEFAVAYISSWVANFATGDTQFNSFVSPPIPIPPNSQITTIDASGGGMKVFVLGAKFRNFAN